MRPRAVEVRVVASVPQRAPSREQSTADPCTAELKPRCTRLPRSSSPDNLPAKPRRSLSRCRSPTLRPCLAQEPRGNDGMSLSVPSFMELVFQRHSWTLYALVVVLAAYLAARTVNTVVAAAIVPEPVVQQARAVLQVADQ